MKSRTTGRFTLFSDSVSQELQSRVLCAHEVKVHNTTGNFNQECVLAYFQVLPALYGEVAGMTIEILKIALETFDISESVKSFAEACLSLEFLDELVQAGFLRKERNENDEPVYFPTEKYLLNCELLEE